MQLYNIFVCTFPKKINTLYILSIVMYDVKPKNANSTVTYNELNVQFPFLLKYCK